MSGALGLGVEARSGAHYAIGFAEAADDPLQRQLAPLVRGHGRGHFDAARVVDECAVELAEAEVRRYGDLLNTLALGVDGARRAVTRT
jgi:hypothetical protein